MKFNKNVKPEIRELLTQQLKEYESEVKMTKEERKELHAWVAKGRSPYDNGEYISNCCGPVDFISALRTIREMQSWFDNLSEEEKQAELNGEYCYQYDTQQDDIYVDIATFKLPNMEDDEELPFN